MTALSSQGSTFSFGTATFLVTAVTVDAPQPEVVNMTAVGDPKATTKMVYTGDYLSPGSVSVEAFAAKDPRSFIGKHEEMKFHITGEIITRQAICSSASIDARVGEILRVRMTFTPTDYVDRQQGGS